jgi:uncharacterized membrane protein
LSRRPAVRLLDGLLAALLLVLLAVLVTGGWRVPLGALTLPVRRAEDVLLAMLPLIALRCWLAPPALPRLAPRALVAAGVALYALAFSFVALTRHHTFQTHGMDLGYYVQEVWLMARGAYPAVSLWTDIHAWGGHLDPIVSLLLPLAWVAPVAEALLVTQSLALALGAVPVYLLGCPRVGPGRAAALALLYLLNPSLHGINVRDFHTAALAIPLLLAAMYGAESGRDWLLWLGALLTLAVREDAAIPVLGLGLWLVLARRRWRAGAALGAAAVAWLFLAVRVIVPFFAGAPYPYFTNRYGHLGASLGAIVLSPLLRPGAILDTLASVDRAVYLGAMLAPLGFLPLLAPAAAVGALPALAQNLLNTDPVLFNYRTQYQCFVLPFLVVGALSGLERLGRLRAVPSPRAVLTFAALAAAALGARTANDFMVPRWWWLGAPARQARAILDRIPPDASVSAWDRFTPHLAERTRVFVFPNGIEESEYLAVERHALGRPEPGLALAREGDRVTLRRGDGPARTFAVVAEAGDSLRLRRAPAGG